jgi:hypothetical protein
MPKKEYTVTLDAKVRTQLEHLLQRGTHATHQVMRPRILRKAVSGWEGRAIAEALSVGRATTDSRKKLNGSIHHFQRDGVLVGE